MVKINLPMLGQWSNIQNKAHYSYKRFRLIKPNYFLLLPPACRRARGEVNLSDAPHPDPFSPRPCVVAGHSCRLVGTKGANYAAAPTPISAGKHHGCAIAAVAP